MFKKFHKEWQINGRSTLSVGDTSPNVRRTLMFGHIYKINIFLRAITNMQFSLIKYVWT